MLVSKEIVTSEIVQFDPEKRFLTVPIERVLEEYNIEPIEPQIALINAVNDPQYRFVVATLARRTGKTFISNLIAFTVLLVPGSTVLIMAPNYSLAQISWELQSKFVKDFNIEITRSNTKDRVLELANGSMLRIGSESQADSVVGRSYDLIIFDEAAIAKYGKDIFNIQLRPTLDKPKSKAIFISTPRGSNWFKEFYDRGFVESNNAWKRWVSIKATVEDNPRADQEDIEDARMSMSKEKFLQEYYCDFIVQQGLVWEFNRECIQEEITIQDDWDIIAGLDIGFKDATAFLVLATDGKKFYAIDEYQAVERATSAHAEILREMIDKWNIDVVYIDSSAAQTKADLIYDYDIPCLNAKKSILDGIGYVSSIIDWDRLIVSRKCSNLLATLDNYKWDDNPHRIKEQPIHDEFSHMADALRYAMYSYSVNMEPILGIE